MHCSLELASHELIWWFYNVRVQSDPAGRLVISGEPEQPDNPWGVTPFQKVISLPSRIDPHQTSAVVTLHGQLFVRVPFEQADL
ncbi:At-rich interactive domain-containing protein [Thalictrum thalictroides]|uniref:At-rich interactive domain-containing protein n=1 Tax=Thalictrum thalictroides TaxID=46969 RepID=A0A7J6WIE5_THATH|nr:At-rich interactive domain-containing protein [Thalictrum thalictroides]